MILEISPAEAHAKMKEESFTSVDVRTEQEFAAGHPDGAFNVPVMITTAAGLEPNPDFIPIIGLMHHRSLAAEAGFYDESFDLFEDWDFLIRLARITRLHRIPRVTAVYRVRDDATNATSQAPWHAEKSQAARKRLFEKHWAARTVDSEMALVDSFQADFSEQLGRVETLSAELRELEVAARTSAALVVNLQGELGSLRADTARTVQASSERESALTAEVARLSNTLDQMNRSLAWRVFAPYWKLKSFLKG